MDFGAVLRDKFKAPNPAAAGGRATSTPAATIPEGSAASPTSSASSSAKGGKVTANQKSNQTIGDNGINIGGTTTGSATGGSTSIWIWVMLALALLGVMLVIYFVGR